MSIKLNHFLPGRQTFNTKIKISILTKFSLKSFIFEFHTRVDMTMTKYIRFFLLLYAFTLPFNAFTLNFIPAIVFVLWLIDGNLREKYNILKRSPLFWVFVSMTLWLLLSLVWSDTRSGGYFGNQSYHDAFRHWLDKYAYPVLIVPVLLTVTDKVFLRQALSAFVAAMLISEILSYGIILHLWEIGRGTPADPTPFIHHSFYSTFLVLTIFVLFYRYFHTRQKLLRYFYLIFALSATLNLFLNGGRTGQAAFLLATLYFTLHHFRYSFRALGATLTALVLIYTAAYHFSPVFQKRMHDSVETIHKMQQGEFQTSFGQRIVTWMATADVLRESPVLGAGIGDARDRMIEIQQKYYPDKPYIITQMQHVHNQFLQTYLDAGIVAMLIWIIFFYLFFRYSFGEFTLYARVYAISLLLFFLIDVPYIMALGAGYVLFFSALFCGYRKHLQSEHSV